jgi:hypothetical protein
MKQRKKKVQAEDDAEAKPEAERLEVENIK